MSLIKRKDVTGSGDSDLQGPAHGGNIVPASPASSSNDGLPVESTESPTGASAISLMALRLSKFLEKARSKLGPRSATMRTPRVQLERLRPECSQQCSKPAVGGGQPEPFSSSLSRREERKSGTFKVPKPPTEKAEVSQPESMDLAESSADSEIEEIGLGTTTSGTDTATEGIAPSVFKKRGRGHTGKLVGVRKAQAELDLLKRKYEELVNENELLTGRFMSKFGLKARGISSADKFAHQFEGRASDVLLQEVLEQMSNVDKVADKFKNLKGTYISHLRVAARRSVAAARTRKKSLCKRPRLGSRSG